MRPVPARAWARWTAPGGVVHAGQVPAPEGLSAGAVVPVWVNAAGRLAPPRPHGSRAPADGMVAVLLLAERLCGAGLAAHRVVDRRRLAAWDEWRATGPPWGGHP